MTLDHYIQKSEKLNKSLDLNVNGLRMPADSRHRCSGACFDIISEHHKGITLLIYKKLYGSAFALIRPIIESYVRGVWLHNCATDEQIKLLIDTDKIKLTFAKLINAIEAKDILNSNILSKLKEKNWPAMCSYTHTGMAQISRRQTQKTIEVNYTEVEIIEALQIADLFNVLSVLAICSLAQNNDLAVQIFDENIDLIGNLS